MRWRVWLIRVIFLAMFAILGFKLYTLQVHLFGTSIAKTQAQSQSSDSQEPLRGLIYATDRNGSAVPLVLNKDYPTIYAVPIEIQDAQEASQELSPIVGKSVADLEELLSKPHSQYALLIGKATDDQVQQTKDLDLKGIYIKDKLFRAYPFGTMAAQVLGFIAPGDGGQLTGRYGLELQFDSFLRGIPVASAASTANFSDTESNGNDLYLTLDYNIQNEAERLISDLNKQWGADGASIIVQEPFSGKILAMATVPTFDPNNYSTYNLSDFINPTVQLPYEPGSVFKMFTMAAGIDSGQITPDTTYTDTGSVKLDKWTISNWDYKTHGPYGKTTMTGVIEHSLNLGAMFAERTTGHSIFLDYVKNFGFGGKTSISLPGELKGNLLSLNATHPNEVNFATASFGQGITATPIQLVTAYSAIANGGVLMKPLVLASDNPQVVRRVISQETDQKLVQMMVSAVDVNILAAIPDYAVAGKTGTAFTTQYNVKGYDETRLINTYLGFAPASNPKFTILVKLDHPKNAPLAGETVVPAFKSMAQFLLNYYNIPPDRIQTSGQ